MKLHENKELLQEAIQATAQQFDLREIYVEKDYWVTVALYHIFHSDIAEQVVFKGGTALSKCHKLIERFSEDIDLVILKNDGENANQLKNKIRSICKVIEPVLPEIQVDGLTNKKGQIRKTVHQYEKVFQGDFGQVREHIVLEATWLGNYEPFTYEPVSCFITEMMKAQGQDDLVKEYNMVPFSIRVLSKERTFSEKIMSLVRFSRTDEPINDLRNKIRHVYDIHLMLMNEDVSRFFESNAFNTMLINVGKDDIISFKNNNAWVHEHPSKAIIFSEPHQTWSDIRTAYQTSFRELVTGILPEEADLVKTLERLYDRLKPIVWNLNEN